MSSTNSAIILEATEEIIDKPETANFVWVDWSKTISIFLVVFIHCLLVMPFSAYLIGMLSYYIIPIFFALSGYFHRVKEPKTYIKKNARSLLRPYAAYYLINYPFWIVSFLYITHKDDLIRNPEMINQLATFKELVLKPLGGLLLGNPTDIEGLSYMVAIPLWFLVSLFTIKLLAIVFVKPNSTKLTILYAVLLTTLGYILHINFRTQYFSLITTLQCYPFFIIGHLVRKHFDISTINRKYCTPLAISLTIILMILVKIDGYGLNLSTREYGIYYAMIYIGGFIGITVVFLVSFYLSKYNSRVLTLFSYGTLIIMGLQGIFLRIFMVLLYFAYPYIYNIEDKTPGHVALQLATAIFISSLTLLLLAPIMKFIHLRMPWLAGKS